MLLGIKKLHYKELFLYGSIFSYIAGMLITIILGIYMGVTLTAVSALSSAVLIVFMFMHYQKYKNYMLTSLVLLWNSILFVSMRIVMYDYGLDIVFLLIPPMVAAILLDKKSLLLHGTIYIVWCFILLRYGYVIYPEHLFLHNKSFMIVFGIFSFFIVAFGAVYHYSIEQSYKRLENSDHQKTFLLQEIHHRVKNNLNMMTSILGLQESKNKSAEIRHFINQNTLRIHSMALVHELLFQNEDLEYINLYEYVQKLVKHIIPNAQKENISITLDIEQIQLNLNNIIHIGIILNEFITNSIKYAFIRDYGEIYISLHKIDREYILKYHDDGIGIKEEDIASLGFGLKLIELSSQQLEGNLVISKDMQGFNAIIRFKGTLL